MNARVPPDIIESVAVTNPHLRRFAIVRTAPPMSAFLACVLLVLSASSASANLVTVDIAAKKAVSDSSAFDPRVVRVMGEQVGVLVYNTTLSPQKVRICFSGLKEQDYDVYINGSYSRVESSKTLTDGIEYTIPGTIADKVAFRCLKPLEPKVAAIYDKMKKQEGEGPARTLSTLQQANEWIAGAFRADTNYRSVEIILVPAGGMMQHMVFASRMDAEAAAQTGRNACRLMHLARSHMFRVLKDPDLRNEVVEALTPVTFTACYKLKNGKPVVTAVVKNDCDLPVSGTISAELPKGWSVSGGKLSFDSLASGKSYETSFGLVSKTKNAKPPKSVPLTAVVTITKDRNTAKVWLFAIAQQ